MKEKDLQQCYNLNTMPASVLGDIILKFLSYKLCWKTFEYNRAWTDWGTFDTIVVSIKQERILASVETDTSFVLEKNRIFPNTHHRSHFFYHFKIIYIYPMKYIEYSHDSRSSRHTKLSNSTHLSGMCDMNVVLKPKGQRN